MSGKRYTEELKELNRSSRETIDSYGAIAVQPRSIAFPPTNQFGFTVTQRLLDRNGNLEPSVSSGKWSRPVFYSSGFTGLNDQGGWVFRAGAGLGGNRWFITFPPQESAYGNSALDSLIIYTPRE